MARRGGLQSNPLADVLAEEEREEAATVAAAQAAGAVVQPLLVQEVAPDPENPESRLTPDQDLVNSIKSEGQTVPGVVVPLDVWVGYGNDADALYRARAMADGLAEDASEADTAKAIEKAKAEIKYVIVYGHRRWAACREAKIGVYKALITDTIKDNTTKRIHRLIENVMRANLKPMEEADEFHRLLTDDKVSQREISRRTGIPQPYISKRISLRRLPKAAKQALTDDVITVEVATELAKMSDDPKRINGAIAQIVSIPVNGTTDDERRRQIDARNRFALELVNRERAAYEAVKELAALRKKLAGEGVTVIDDLSGYFSDKQHPRWKYQIHGDDAIKTARDAGTAVAYVYSRDRVEWYSTEEPREPEPAGDTDTNTAAGPAGDVIPAPRNGAAPSEPRETDAQRQRREENERRQREKAAADEARTAACLRLTSKAPNRDQLTARLARRVLMDEDSYDYERDAQRLALEWLKAAEVIDAEISTGTLFGEKNGLDSKTYARVAFVYDLALDEARARESDELDTQDGEHIERLMKEAGYTPSTWEQQRLDELAVATS